MPSGSYDKGRFPAGHSAAEFHRRERRFGAVAAVETTRRTA